MAEVVLDKVSKVFDGGVKAVDQFSLSIQDREFVVLVGPSGCGKSTTLRMVAGLEEISSGDLSIDGKRMNDVPPKDRDIAMVFQNYALYPHMNVYDNMAFGLKLRKFPRPEIDTRVREAAQILGLTDYLERKPKALSGGQRQRVAVGRAIVRKPKVFLFDEPLSNLDAKMRVQMRKEICQLHTRLQATMIYVTHDQVEAMTMGDRIVVMDNGLIQQIGNPMQIYRQPKNRFVAGFIGSPAMNFLECRVSDGKLQINDASCAVAPGLAKTITTSSGSVVLGIRPEDLSATPQENSLTLQGTVDLSEPLGSEVLVYFSTGSTPLVAKILNGAPLRVGEKTTYHVPLQRAHFFDSQTGTAL